MTKEVEFTFKSTAEAKAAAEDPDALLTRWCAETGEVAAGWTVPIASIKPLRKRVTFRVHTTGGRTLDEMRAEFEGQ